MCRHCLDEIPLNRIFYCALCKKPSNWNLICPQCRQRSKLKAIWVAADYNNQVLQDLLHALKYKYIEGISAVLASLNYKYLTDKNIFQQFNLNTETAVFVPVPLHHKRWLTRGFNQSELIAKELSGLSGISAVNLLKRVKNTETQINLKRHERQANVKEAFIVNTIKLDKTKKIILIDDVVTTGSTLNECANSLAVAGFTEIYGLVVAQRED